MVSGTRSRPRGCFLVVAGVAAATAVATTFLLGDRTGNKGARPTTTAAGGGGGGGGSVSTVPTSVPTASTIVTGPTTTAVSTDDEKVAECRRRAAEAFLSVRFGTAYDMTVGAATTVVVYAGLGSGPINSATITQAVSTTTATIFETATCVLEAQLTGTLFTIDPYRPVRQSFTGTDVLAWQWSVTPTSVNATLLTVAITEIAVLDSGSLLEGAQKTANLTITVHAAPSAPGTPLLHRATTWLFGTLAAAVAIVIGQWVAAWFGPSKDDSNSRNVFRRIRARRRKNSSPTNPPDTRTTGPPAPAKKTAGKRRRAAARTRRRLTSDTSPPDRGRGAS